MASKSTSGSSMEKKKLRVLLLPFFGTSHIQPFTEFAISLAAANDAVEATVAVTPANVALVESLLLPAVGVDVKVASYPFPRVEGLPVGVENSGKGATAEESLRIVLAATDESVTRPVQEALIRAQCPDAIVTDLLFPWSVAITDELGVPCVAFNVIGAFPMLVIRQLAALQLPAAADAQVAAVRAGISETEVPGWVRKDDYAVIKRMNSLEAECFGMVMNTLVELEEKYCEVYTRAGYVKRAYFVGPLPLLLRSSSSSSSSLAAEGPADKYIMEWLDSKADRSVVYISLGCSNESHVKDGELEEIAAGLEETSLSFVWVVRGKEHWTPPAGWEDRVKHRGLLIRFTTTSSGGPPPPQTAAILGHKAVGAFVTHCGWKPMQETVAAGVPVLAWPSTLLEQHITERMMTEVLGMGDRLARTGTGSKDLARAITTFMRPGGPRDAARVKLMELAPKVHAAVEEGGSSHRDLRCLVDDLLIAAAKRPTT